MLVEFDAPFLALLFLSSCFLLGVILSINITTQKEYFARGFVCAFEGSRDLNEFVSYDYEPSAYCSAFSNKFSRVMRERAGVFEWKGFF